MEKARTQFPSYMSRIYGHKPSYLKSRPYEIPNLTLFPKKKQANIDDQATSES